MVRSGSPPRRRARDRVAIAQALFYVPTGVWPLVSIRTFEMVTGPKVDRWLVKTVGLLIALIGGAVGWAGWRGRVAPETAALAAGSALSLAAVDVVYATRGRISKVYLLDAVAEVALVVVWLVGWRRAA